MRDRFIEQFVRDAKSGKWSIDQLRGDVPMPPDLLEIWTIIGPEVYEAIVERLSKMRNVLAFMKYLRDNGFAPEYVDEGTPDTEDAMIVIDKRRHIQMCSYTGNVVSVVTELRGGKLRFNTVHNWVEAIAVLNR